MNPHSENQIDNASAKDQPKERRTLRFLFSFGVIVFVGFLIVVFSSQQDRPVLFLLGLYIGYIITCATLVSAIAVRLFNLHQVRELKLDLASMLLLTTLLALPLGISNLFVNIYSAQALEDTSLIETQATLVIAGVFYFLTIPILSVCEALMFWAQKYLANKNTKRTS